MIFDGHQPEYPGDFTSVEQTVDEVTEYLKSRSAVRLDAAYGCSLGGACLTRLLAQGEIRVDRAVIDGGITPYQFPYLLRRLRLALDVLSFKIVANSRSVLEAAFPPERFTLPGHDPVKEYDEMERYLKTYSARTVRNVFWSGNNYALPETPAESDTKLFCWYGEDEKKDRRGNIRFIRRYFPQIQLHEFPRMAHAELVIVHPEEFCRCVQAFLTGQMDAPAT